MSGKKYNLTDLLIKRGKKKKEEEDEEEDTEEKAYQKKYVHKNEDESEEEDEDLESYEQETVQDTFASSKRLNGSRITVPSINNAFLSGDLEDIRKQEPPYVPHMYDDELQLVVDYERERMPVKKKLNKDPYIQFINMVASITETDVSKLTRSPSDRGTNGGTGGVAYGGSSLTRGLSPNGRPGFIHQSGAATPRTPTQRPFQDPNPFPRPPRTPDETDIQRVLDREANRQGILGKRFERTRQDDNLLNGLSSREVEEKTQDYIKRSRIYENLAWIERPDVLGIQDMSPKLAGSLRNAHNRIKLRCPGLVNTRIEDFIEENDTMAEIFARLVGAIMKLNRFDAGTNSQFQRNHKNYETDIELAIRELKNYSFSGDTFKRTYAPSSRVDDGYNYEPIPIGSWFTVKPWTATLY